MKVISKTFIVSLSCKISTGILSPLGVPWCASVRVVGSIIILVLKYVLNVKHLEILTRFWKCPGSLVGSVLDYLREGCGFDSHQKLWSVTLHRAHGRGYSSRI